MRLDVANERVVHSNITFVIRSSLVNGIPSLPYENPSSSRSTIDRLVQVEYFSSMYAVAPATEPYNAKPIETVTQ